MKALRLALALAAVVLIIILGVILARGRGGAAPDGEELRVVATFSVIHDIATAIGGERVEVHSMVPLGQDPHEYTPLPLDVRKATDADVVLWNGLDMELGDGWFEGLLSVAGKSLDDGTVFALAEGIEPMYLTDEEGRREKNPHAFLDPVIAMQYVRNTRDALVAVDPEHADVYRENAAAYLRDLEALDERYAQLLGEVPEEDRILVTAERAFQYMAARYGLREGYVWAIDTDEQGTPQQIVALIDFVRRNGVQSLFLESNVDPRALETVSRETGVPIVGTVYSDELGRRGEAGGTLLGMLEWNLDTIHEGLTGE